MLDPDGTPIGRKSRIDAPNTHILDRVQTGPIAKVEFSILCALVWFTSSSFIEIQLEIHASSRLVLSPIRGREKDTIGWLEIWRKKRIS